MYIPKNLAGWKKLYLSKVGKTYSHKKYFIQFTYLSPFSFSNSSRYSISYRTTSTKFSLGGLGDVSKRHLVNWSKVCSPVQYGVLAIRNLRYFYEALLGKWLWRFGYEREALWRRVIRAKYGVEEGDWCFNSVLGSYGVSLWKTISSGWSTFSRYI